MHQLRNHACTRSRSRASNAARVSRGMASGSVSETIVPIMSALDSQAFDVNPKWAVHPVAIGKEHSPLVCIDDFLQDPDALVAHSQAATFIELGSLYPGVRASASSEYVRTLIRAVGPIVREVFGTEPEPELELCAFSLVTTPPGKLRLAQRIPHFDGVEPHRFAFVHYLCDAKFGGTSFYRHRATGFERVDAKRLGVYRDRLSKELGTHQLPLAYTRGTTDLFERVYSVEARYNRLIVYLGNSLHSGDIPEGMTFTEDPAKGRLTVNGFGFLAI